MKHSPPQQSPTGQTKRRKCSSDLNIADLPDEGLRLIADYLPKNSCALLALAITTDSASWRDINWNNSTAPTLTSFLRGEKQQRPLAASRAVLLRSCAGGGNDWEHVDFVDIGDLAGKLNDDDVAGFLMCINAIGKLKTLKLTGLVKITGRGLAPLRGSRVLEQLDLSLVGLSDKPELLDPEPCLKDTVVMPILESILIDQEDHNLKHLQFPSKWKKKSGVLDNFLLRFNETEYRNNICCLQCGRRCKDVLARNRGRGKELNTCYGCLKHYCYGCADEDLEDRGQWKPMLALCHVCEKEFCAKCIKFDSGSGINVCDSRTDCNNYVCYRCYDKGNGRCNECEQAFCKDCQENDFFSCDGCGYSACYMCMIFDECEYEGCDAMNCQQCKDGKVNPVSYCCEIDCQKPLCVQHRLEECNMDWTSCCEGCMRLIGPDLYRVYAAQVTTSA